MQGPDLDVIDEPRLVHTIDHDLNGLATQVTDAAGGATKAGYSANENLLWLQDANHASYTGGTPSEYRGEHFYDAYGRLVRSSQPKSTAFTPGLLTWEGMAYDANDNETSMLASHFGRGDGGNGALTTTTYDAMDRETLVTGPRTVAQGGPVKTQTEYDAAGRVTRVTEPKGVDAGTADDYVTETAYDLLDREQTVTAYAVEANATRITNYCYDDAGDLRSLTGPKGAAGFTGCPNPAAEPYVYTSATHTTKFEYDDAHRQLKATDALGQVTQTAYDENGQVTSETDEAGKLTTTSYTDRGEKSKLVEPFDTGRTLSTISEYDPLGNLKRLISPRAFDDAGGQAPYTDYVESYSYDALNRLLRTSLPAGGPSYVAEVQSDNPVAYWRLHSAPASESNAGSAGSALNLAYSGSVTSVAGVLADDNAARFNGSSYATVSANPGSYGIGASSVTLEAWVDVPDTSRKGAFVHVGNGSNGYALGVGSSTFDNLGNHLIGLFEGVTWINTGVDIGTGWHHVAMTIGPSTTTFYLDGVQVASSASGASAPTGFFDVGGYSNSSRRFDGTVDEAAVYASVLSAARIAAHHQAGKPTPQAFRHQAYDANGNTLWTSLPTTASTPGAVTQQEKTSLTYWDTGSIYSSQDPVNPKVRFDYSAEGWQASRVPELVGQAGFLNFAQAMYWSYLPDGLHRALLDQGGERALYAYDANGNRTQATEATGLVNPGQTPLQIDLAYSSLDELSKVRTPKPGVSGTYLATELTYDLHGNTSQLIDNEEENGSGSQTAAGRVFAYSYNAIDQATAQTDDFATSGTTDDEQLLYTYKSTGELDTQTLQKRPAGSWVDEQSSVRAYFENGLLKTLTNKDGAGVTKEQHTLSYLAGGLYLNGNRASDVFQLKGPDTAAACYATTCTASWLYDARERVTHENPGTGSSTGFTLDVQGNVTREATGAATTTRTFAGQQLQSEDFSSGTDKRYLYDSLGSTDCVVKLAYAGTSCPAAGSTDLLEDNLYDYKSRLSGYRYYNGQPTASKVVDYTNDPLDRPVKQVETISGSTTTYDFTYVGVTNALSKEVLTGGTSTTKKYAYDAFGNRSTITEGSNRYSYLYDLHGSVSLLIDQANAVKESYGYAAYGAANAALSKTAAGFNAKTNPYRYTGKRLDSGSGTYDMGARRYSASTGRFLQYDVFSDALDNLGLSEDPLTQNRYALAGGNPINFVEIDGHRSGPLCNKIRDSQRRRQCFSKVEGVEEDPWPELLFGGVGGLVKGGIRAGAKTALGLIGKEGAEAVARRAPSAGVRAADRIEDIRATRTYQTYTKTHPQTGQVYSGRTSGYGTPSENIRRRNAGHHLNREGFGPAKLDRSSTSRDAIRGREQRLVERHGGAQSTGGTSANRINPISPRNPNRDRYLRAADRRRT